jgi:hypothetical protein
MVISGRGVDRGQGITQIATEADTFPIAAMHKYAAWLASRQARSLDCDAASDAKSS